MKKKIFIILLASMCILAGCSQHAKKVTKSIHKPTQLTSKKKKVKESDKITQIINKMTLDEKIGQLYFAHSTGNFVQMKQDVKKYHLGGNTLFAPDFKDKNHAQFKNEMHEYQKVSQHGLLIATDQEGGTVSRLNSNHKISSRKFPSPQEIYQQKGLAGIKTEDSEVAELLHQNGINMNFAPVADVAKSKNSFIYNRTLAPNYKLTAKYIPIAVKAIQNQHVASCLKHFPGYGDANDTHTGFAQINKPLANYQKEDLLPFKAGINAGVDSMMVSHIVIDALDSNVPASLSPAVHKLLRQNLHYNGIIITDDLQMGAITEYAKKHNINPDVLALKAGNDMLLGGDYQTGIPAIKKSVKAGQINQKQVNQSVRRILLLKQKLGILK